MRFTTVLVSMAAATVLAAPVAKSNDITASEVNDSVEAAAVPELNEDDVEQVASEIEADEADNSVQARAASAITGAIIDILTPAATDLTQKAVDAAITASGNLVKAVKDWDSARETFTKTTVQNMYKSKPAGYVGAVCCNVGYSNSGGVSNVVKAKLQASALNTDYDCFYTKKGNVFTIKGDGGFINVATVGCTFKGKTMTC